MKNPTSSRKPASKPGAPKIKRKPAPERIDAEELEDHDEDEEKSEAEEAEEETEPSPQYKRQETTGSPAGFMDTLGEALRSAGQTAQRYTRIGVSHAEIEKLRFELRAAHAELGEVVMRCWSDAPNLGLTSKDPAIQKAVKQVKEVRLKIREKEARIASLKSES